MKTLGFTRKKVKKCFLSEKLLVCGQVKILKTGAVGRL
jgi:hypothetical protein